MQTQKYKKKPVVIEAVQFLHDPDDISTSNMTDIIQWILDNGGNARSYCVSEEDCLGNNHLLEIETLEGSHFANHADFIIRGIQGEFYPCKPDIFEDSYEKVED